MITPTHVDLIVESPMARCFSEAKVILALSASRTIAGIAYHADMPLLPTMRVLRSFADRRMVKFS